MAKKKNNINVERIGETTDRPITTSPVPVRRAWTSKNTPLTLFSNGTRVDSVVDKNGVNHQTFYKSNGAPSYGFEINVAGGTEAPDTLSALKYNHPNDLIAYKKFKPGSHEFERIAKNSKQYNVPLATYGEAYDNYDEVQRQASKFLQKGGTTKEELVQSLESAPYGRHNVAQRNQMINMVKSFGEDTATRQQIWNNPSIHPEKNIATGLNSANTIANKLNPAIKPSGNTTNVVPNIYERVKEPPTSFGFKRNNAEGLQEGEKVSKQVGSFQPGGSIASRIWNKWTGKDTYVDGYGVTRHHTPVKESAHHTLIKAANSPLVQSIPVVGDIADGYVAADYAKKGDYKPAMAAIGAGLILPNAAEVAGRMVPSSTYRKLADKVDDFVEILGVETPRQLKHNSDDLVEILDVEMPDGKKWNRTPDQKFNNVENNFDRWIPETQYDDDLNVIAGSLDDSMSSEPWWGWDPVEYQKGGNLPSDNQQQQLFVAIITDMAKTLGVEPSQELAEAVMAAFENNDDSQGLLTLFTKTKDKFMNETGLFREGGKMIAFIEKFGCGGKKTLKKTAKKEEGGEVEDAGAAYITTPVNDRQMRRNWREATGGTRREARQVQRNLTDHIESQGGISHGGARNAAAAMMGDPQRFAQHQESRALGGVSTPTLNVPAPQLGTPASLEHNYDNFDFNTAFGRARRNGEDIFTWKGKEYTTELAPEKKSGVSDPGSSVVSNPDLLMGSPTTGGNYYDPNTNPLYRLGANWKANRDARRAARQERRENDPRWGHGALIGAETAMGAAVGSAFGPVGTLVGAGIGAGIGAGSSYLARRRAQQNQ